MESNQTTSIWHSSVMKLAREKKVEWLFPESATDHSFVDAFNDEMTPSEFVESVIEDACGQD